MSDLFVKSNNTSDDFKISTLTFEYVNNANNVQQGGNISDPTLTELFDNESITR